LPEDAAERTRFVQVLAGRGHQACVDFTCLNAAAVLRAGGVADDWAAGVAMSRAAIGDGRALNKLWEWVGAQNRDAARGQERLERVLEGAQVARG
jgi:anthranilate phosphoribosyltransferase